ncbi:MAG: ABC transporter permease [Deltaproteobacteria bacterium]|nr:ABC transporter permease [Deltaproteobacteria bacterium]
MSTKSQSAILADRYLDVMLGDPTGLLLTLLQSPLLGLGVIGVWSNQNHDGESMYFVLCLCAFFMGLVDAAREIVKERSLFLREKMFNLRPGAYLGSKLQVLAAVVLIQSVALVAVVHNWIAMHVSMFAVGVFVFLVGLVGVATGLVISAWVKTADKAMAFVPLVVIPQILFSDFVIGKNKLSNWTGVAQDVMPVEWAYMALVELRKSSSLDWGVIFGAPLVLILMVVLASIGALLALKWARYA